jgi:hypothetical protein
MLRQGYLAPAAWQSVYTVFLSLVTLIFFLGTQHGNKEYAAVRQETETGIRILYKTSCQDIGSRRCLDVLRVLTRRLSHIIDIDVDKLDDGGERLCQNQNQNQNQNQHPPAQSMEPRRPTSQAREEGQPYPRTQTAQPETSVIQPVSGDPRQLAQPQQPSPLTTPQINVNTGNMPRYHPPAMPYHTQLPVWEQPLTTPSTTGSTYIPPQLFSYEGRNPAPEPAEQYGPSEMEVPYTEGFAWPFQLSSDTMAEGSGSSGRRVPAGNLPLTQEDIAAFMKINPGEEPFL